MPAMPAKLVVISSNFAGQEFPLTRREMVIGRGEDCDIIIDHRSVSQKHAKVVRESTGGEYKIVDLKSKNGVKVSGEDYRAVLASEQHLDPDLPWLLASAMMRPGDKLKSYQILAQALRAIPDMPWQLVVAGEGKAYDAVTQAFAWAQPERVRFLGLVQPEVIPALYSACDLLVWPAVNEAFGMALMEAQAAGIPVVAGRSPGVENVVLEGVTGYLADPGLATFAASVREMLSQKASRVAMGAAAPKVIAEQHSLVAAARRLNAILDEVSKR